MNNNHLVGLERVLKGYTEVKISVMNEGKPCAIVIRAT